MGEEPNRCEYEGCDTEIQAGWSYCSPHWGVIQRSAGRSPGDFRFAIALLREAEWEAQRARLVADSRREFLQRALERHATAENNAPESDTICDPGWDNITGIIQVSDETFEEIRQRLQHAGIDRSTDHGAGEPFQISLNGLAIQTEAYQKMVRKQFDDMPLYANNSPPTDAEVLEFDYHGRLFRRRPYEDGHPDPPKKSGRC